jgi:hypothetical protein
LEWHQDCGNAQRTGYTAEEPDLPWTLAWTWNGPDESGGAGDHFYNQPASYTPWEARTVTGGAHLYVPATDQGLYALRKSNGTIAWQFTGETFDCAPAYDPSTGHVYAAARSGVVYKLAGDGNGTPVGEYDAGAAVRKAVMVVSPYVYVVTEAGDLHKIDGSDMTNEWTYPAGSEAHTPPAYSVSRDAIVFCTADLHVHGVNNSDGSEKWKVKPTAHTAGYPYEFEGGWPAIAEEHGIAFVRVNLGIDLIFGPGDWPMSNAERRTKLTDEPQWKNLFPLDLDDGSEVFVPAVGPQGVEDFGSSPNLRVHSFPVIKSVDSRELAYQTFREEISGNDPRWDSHIGEMVLDDQTVSGYAAGDLRHIDVPTAWSYITDESCPLTMAGDVLFFSHWAATGIHRITDRGAALGATQDNPIATTRLPAVGRANTCGCSDFASSPHFSNSCAVVYDHENEGCSGRWLGSGNWYVYNGIIDPPTPLRGAYSEGILPRYAYVADGLVVVEGNGGDLFVLRHSGDVVRTDRYDAPVGQTLRGGPERLSAGWFDISGRSVRAGDLGAGVYIKAGARGEAMVVRALAGRPTAP